MNKAYSFYLNGKPLNAKKFKPTETLDNVRKSLNNKIDSTIIFLNNEMPIDVDDESGFSLQEIEDNGKVYLKNDANYNKNNNNINPQEINEQVNKQRETNEKEIEDQNPKNRSGICTGCFIF